MLAAPVRTVRSCSGEPGGVEVIKYMSTAKGPAKANGYTTTAALTVAALSHMRAITIFPPSIWSQSHPVYRQVSSTSWALRF